jgi:hypothetical protein
MVCYSEPQWSSSSLFAQSYCLEEETHKLLGWQLEGELTSLGA